MSAVAFVFPLIAAAAILLAARAVGASARRRVWTVTPNARVIRLRAMKRGSIYAAAFGLVVVSAGISEISSPLGPAAGLEILIPGLALLGAGVFGYVRLRAIR